MIIEDRDGVQRWLNADYIAEITPDEDGGCIIYSAIVLATASQAKTPRFSTAESFESLTARADAELFRVRRLDE